MSIKKPTTPEQTEQVDQVTELIKQLIANPIVDGVNIQANGLLVEFVDEEEG